MTILQTELQPYFLQESCFLATFNNLKADLTRSRIVIDEKNKQIEELTSKLNKSEILHREFIKASKELSTNMISSGGTFDKKLTDLRECTDQMKTLCYKLIILLFYSLHSLRIFTV